MTMCCPICFHDNYVILDVSVHKALSGQLGLCPVCGEDEVVGEVETPAPCIAGQP